MNARRWGRPAAVAVAAMLGLAACGGSGGGSSSYKQPTGAAQTTIAVSGHNFGFDPSSINAPAGVDAIKFNSTEGLHTFVFAGGKAPGFKLQASSGNSDQLKVNLKPGKYTFYCDIPGHREAGMQGTLTVK